MTDADTPAVEPHRIERWSPMSGTSLVERESGLWTAAVREDVSYPDAGNGACFRVEDTSFWFRHRNACILAVMRRLGPNGLFADVGGGNGFVAKALIDAGFAVALVEPGSVGARNAWERGVRPVICATLDQAGFPAGSLGGIGIFDVLEHIDDDVAFLEQLRYHLRPDGRLYITVPAFNALWSSEDEAAGHYRRYRQSTLRAALDRAGFAVEYLSGIFAWLPIPVLLFRSIPSRLGLRDATAGRADDEHGIPANWFGKVLEELLVREHKRIARGDVLPIGGSLIAVARPK